VKFLSKHLSAEFRSYIRGHTVRIIADASNGSAGEIIKRFLLNNDITYELLFTHPDGTFYGHNPNPLNPDAPRVISKKIPIFKADFGFIVDPDADRILFIDDTGCVVENNYLDCLVVEDLLRKHKHSSVVYDLVSRRILSETIKKGLGKAVVSKVGTSNMITAMKSNKAVFGSEMSGHRYFGFMNNQDSGLMMLVHVLNTLYSKKYCKHKLSTLVKKYDKYVDLGELNYSLSGDSKKKLVLDKIVKYYSDNKKKLFVKQISQLDGVSIITKNYWFNIRPSNTEPLLRLRLEGHDKKTLLAVKFTIEKFLK
jgi:phosphomannomutase